MQNILVFGDSNTWGYDASTYDENTGLAKRMPFEQRWPGILARLLDGECRIIEDALNARTLMTDDPYARGRMGLQSLKIALDAHAPLDLVILQLGCNELKERVNLSEGMIAYGMEQLVKACQTAYYGYPIPKVLVIAPSPTHPKIAEMRFGFAFGTDAYAKSLAFGSLYKELAKRYNCGFVDCAPLQFELNDGDGLHYAIADHAKLAPVVAREVRRLFSEN